MKTWKVNADFQINVCVEVEAETEEQAYIEAKHEILSKNCEWLDPIDDPKINWAEQCETDDYDEDEF